MKRLGACALAVAALLAVSGCTPRNYETLKPDEKIFYGTLIYIPEVKGGIYEGTVPDPSQISSSDSRSYFDPPQVNICSSSSSSSTPDCQFFLKGKTWVADNRDITTAGYMNIDAKDAFGFLVKPNEKRVLSGFKVGEYSYWLKEPIPLQGAERVNYLGNIVIQLKQTNNPELLGMEASATDQFQTNSAMLYQWLKIPMNVPSGMNILNLQNAQYDITRTVVVSQSVPIFIPKVK